MIKRLNISGIAMEVDKNLGKYVTKKIGRLDRFIPRNKRANVHADVKLKEANAKNKKELICEVILHVPHEVITVKEATISMYAAVDIVETKLRHQLKKYKELHSNPRLHQRLLHRLKHMPDPAE